MQEKSSMRSQWNETLKKRVTLLFLVSLLGIFVGFTPHSPKGVLRKIVLDAGHGGSDPGNLGTGRYKKTEKDITLEVILQLGKLIKEQFPDVEIVYTRKDDTFVELNRRVKIANTADADLFISVHCDAFTKATAKGSSTFVMGMHKTEESLRVAMKENAAIYREANYEENYSFDPNDPDTYIALTLRQNAYLDQSLQLSSYVQEQFRDRVGRVDRGVKQAGFYVISFTTMPSILIEMGFLTNPDEEDFLNSEQGKTYMSSAIFRAFKQYKLEIDGLTPAPEAKPSRSTLASAEGEKPKNESDTAWIREIKREGAKEKITFQIQIVTSSVRIGLNPENFRGLSQVDEYFSDGLYKYAVGLTSNYSEAKHMQEVLRKHGFAGAFVIAFRNADRISLAEALEAKP
jgi:N-acetylmuramoyl-L-alanine amidase